MNIEADSIRQSLNVFLEKKRDGFPRLFFISNEEIMTIFGKAEQIIDQLIEGTPQAFLVQLFEGIDKLNVDPKTKRIVSMVSKQGEEIRFSKEIDTNENPEMWLRNLETMMAYTLKEKMINCFEDMDLDIPLVPQEVKPFKDHCETMKSLQREVDPVTLSEWVHNFPGQCLYTSMQIWFTMKVESIFEGANKRRFMVIRQRQTMRDKMGQRYNEDETDEYDLKLEEPVPKVEDVKETTEEEDSDYSSEETAERIRQEKEMKAKLEAIAKANEPVERIYLTPLERLMRYAERFLVTPGHHPNKQFSYLTSTIKQKTEILAELLCTPLEQHVRSSAVGLITALVYQRDLSDKMNKQRIYKETDFDWQLAYKMKFHGLEEATAQLDGMVKWNTDMKEDYIQAKKEPRKISIEFDLLDCKKWYGFEYLGNCPRLVVTPLTERCQRALLIALQY